MLEIERRVMGAAMQYVAVAQEVRRVRAKMEAAGQDVSRPQMGLDLSARFHVARSDLHDAVGALPEGYEPPGDLQMAAEHGASLEEMTAALGGTMHTIEIPEAVPTDNRE